MPGGAVTHVVGAAVAGAIAWVAAPWVAMARRGTIDERTVEGWRDVDLPQPRPAPDDLPAPVIPLQRQRSRPAPVPRREGGFAP